MVVKEENPPMCRVRKQFGPLHIKFEPWYGGVSAWSWPLGGPLLFLSLFHSDKTVVKTDTYSWLAVAFVLLKEVNPQMNLLCKAKNHFSFPPPFFGIYSVGFYCLLLILIFYTFCAQNTGPIVNLSHP